MLLCLDAQGLTRAPSTATLALGPRRPPRDRDHAALPPPGPPRSLSTRSGRQAGRWRGPVCRCRVCKVRPPPGPPCLHFSVPQSFVSHRRQLSCHFQAPTVTHTPVARPHHVSRCRDARRRALHLPAPHPPDPHALCIRSERDEAGQEGGMAGHSAPGMRTCSGQASPRREHVDSHAHEGKNTQFLRVELGWM